MNACPGNLPQIHYYYTVERLGGDGCGADHQAVNFYRITLVALPNQRHKVTLRLQSTVAALAKEKIPCQNNVHQVTLGRKMWREI